VENNALAVKHAGPESIGAVGLSGCLRFVVPNPPTAEKGPGLVVDLNSLNPYPRFLVPI